MSVDPGETPTIDDVRAYWDRRPCNVRHSQKVVGTREYFDEVEARRYKVEPHIPAFAEFGRWRGRKVLEIGCGIGTDGVGFARAGAEYTGIELSGESLEIARKRFALYDLPGSFASVDAERLAEALPAGHFDLIYSFGVIHHTPHQRAVIEQMRKVIKPGGEIRIMLYARNSWKDAMIEAGLDQPEAQNGCPIATTYTAETVRELLAGLFEPTAITQAHIFPYEIESYVRHEYKLQPWFAAMPPGMFDALGRRFGWHLLIRAEPI